MEAQIVLQEPQVLIDIGTQLSIHYKNILYTFILHNSTEMRSKNVNYQTQTVKFKHQTTSKTFK